VIVDPTNPIGPDDSSGFQKIIGEQEPSGQILAGLLPTGARLVKAFGTLSAPTLAATARQEPDRAVLFHAADDEGAGDVVDDLIGTGGLPAGRGGDAALLGDRKPDTTLVHA
jgi:8-hydroxy-5-deazaflavin:NADPH oxidoreductase